ncbi:STAS domain-containing protein [Phycicoccus sp. CSK15P-2]|uniref:STAS domain-containing protein n=1 Tax=Phycicoccus sp. CSK15P-2 TaxID=2807627 RepID=UPI00194E7568|nr:STAS domain-containing protein [Phycicoccus sp. CSK15P-2]MBM6405291.1 STAS domain-containing protein [Phycicoccus sp. CSK15P-2]
MEIHTEPVTGYTVLACAGRLTMQYASRLREAVDAAVGSGTPNVVVDLSGTSFVDSSGLGALVAGLRVARTAGGDLRIAAPTEQVSSVLSLTNLDRVLTPHPSVEEAARGW